MQPEFDEETGGLIPKTLKRSASQSRLTRSSSVDRFDKPLDNTSRKRTREGALLKEDAMLDFSTVAVYSREAFENFGKTWKIRMNTDSLDRATKTSRAGQKDDDVADRLSRLPRATVSTGFKDQIQALFEKRLNPHIIAVIEGKQEESTLSIKTQVEDKDVALAYSRTKFVQGLNKRGSIDQKQSMGIYVRDDMKSVYSFSDELIKHGDGVIKAVGINYETTDGTKYRSLVVHIPNEFLGSDDKEKATHQAFETYAKEEKEKSGVIVTGYLGDTNYKSPIFKNSAPSIAGHLRSGDTANPQSSGAQHETNFMQSIPLGEARTDFEVMQPATLNPLFIVANKTDPEATDHPSFISFTSHPSELKLRNPDANPDYYLPVKIGS